MYMWLSLGLTPKENLKLDASLFQVLKYNGNSKILLERFFLSIIKKQFSLTLSLMSSL